MAAAVNKNSPNKAAAAAVTIAASSTHSPPLGVYHRTPWGLLIQVRDRGDPGVVRADHQTAVYTAMAPNLFKDFWLKGRLGRAKRGESPSPRVVAERVVQR
jgi:hypothetical protein